MKSVRNVVWMAIVFVATATGNASGATISIDPGPLGNVGPSILREFSDLNGTVLNGQDLELDFVFDLMKHVEIPDSVTQFTAQINVFTDIPTETSPATGFLSDENGDPILVGLTSGGATTTQPSFSAGVFFLDTPTNLIFHDVHLSLAAPTNGAMVTTAFLQLTTFGDSDLIVGQWVASNVPEPVTATLSLMGLGVLGMATRRRVV